ncbi:hypothetical protein TcasGA2_TC010457 [Tribolium castaneum]|uniref:Uncharacterized protein n=1 Tax=Tribolium castaneum TaxID=7070 RepID=D6WKR4_TRICA|nr:PREDICTED: uncharacterized protein LOC103314936 [Tribolium castaneum]EFA03032.1 hypothetical protein TcasGA2_TC010457 [Tribolium castaneum]|eukprot:XP_008200475.1 PREDICTED: uncharacterized protein LOC103314936 [Tribolium castaneum]
MSASLSREQEAFLEECALEFSDRFTDADFEYKKIFDLGIPKPPIMSPWYSKARFNRDRGENRYNERRDYRSDNHRDRSSYYKDRRYRPY